MYFIHCCHKRAEEFISLYDVLQMRQAYNVEKGLNLGKNKSAIPGVGKLRPPRTFCAVHQQL